MIELSNERIGQILEDETAKTADLKTILRSIYTRYRNLYEPYIANFDKLNDDKVAEFAKDHEETKALIKYYYLDIPQDVCTKIEEFEEKSCDKLLGREWKSNVYDAYDEFKTKNKVWSKGDDYYQAEFKKMALKEFYEAMDYIFRDGFGTGSETVNDIMGGITGLFFGKKEK